MSATADFLKLQVSALDKISPADVRRLGQAVADFQWSGYILTVTLCYLQERQQIDLLHSDTTLLPLL
jgi:hypothetical protein